MKIEQTKLPKAEEPKGFGENWEFKVHGNNGGPNRTGGKYTSELKPGEKHDYSVPSIDKLDEIYKKHDFDYDHMPRRAADKLLLERLSNYSSESVAHFFKKWATIGVFYAKTFGSADPIPDKIPEYTWERIKKDYSRIPSEEQKLLNTLSAKSKIRINFQDLMAKNKGKKKGGKKAEKKISKQVAKVERKVMKSNKPMKKPRQSGRAPVTNEKRTRKTGIRKIRWSPDAVEVEGCCRFRQEDVSVSTSTIQGEVLFNETITPDNFEDAMFQMYANAYDDWQIKGMTFDFAQIQPPGNSLAVGRLLMGIDYDPDDNDSDLTYSKAQSAKTKVTFQLTEGGTSLRLDKRQMNTKKLFTNQKSSIEDDTLRWTSPGTLFVVADSAGFNNMDVGSIWVDYLVRFSAPIIEFDSNNLQAQVYNCTTPNKASLLGTSEPTGIAGNNIRASRVNGNTWSLNQVPPGDYELFYYYNLDSTATTGVTLEPFVAGTNFPVTNVENKSLVVEILDTIVYTGWASVSFTNLKRQDLSISIAGDSLNSSLFSSSTTFIETVRLVPISGFSLFKAIKKYEQEKRDNAIVEKLKDKIKDDEYPNAIGRLDSDPERFDLLCKKILDHLQEQTSQGKRTTVEKVQPKILSNGIPIPPGKEEVMEPVPPSKTVFSILTQDKKKTLMAEYANSIDYNGTFEDWLQQVKPELTVRINSPVPPKGGV